ncbi:ABC-2 type transport system ATP-binding protein [Chitinophaga rupis]|uniref:ABC-2 type transport system ATP-binding protein n=1 Tax=Chitinophaga rupis TaxID=573321 RepID=A0A1H7SVJ5_9BACT|nr:ATP-binding cassette domain-containing protein [Chitinophaga rupis]SEL76329.1 ABC-2 type transport system ATP-binding protein [Chitinophaga rupis]
MEHIVLTNGLKKSFKTQGKTVEAVRGVDLAVRRGEVFGFLGPNGAGKTTTLRMLTTLLTPDAGEATLAGCDLLKHPQRLRERIGYVSQAGGSDRGMSAWENLVLQGRLFGMNRHNAAAQAKALILAFDLEAIVDRKAATYSGGQRRRLDVALGMMHRPQLLFLDEPTTGLDPQNRARLWEEVRRLRDSGVTIFLTTHYLDEADALADRIAIMDQGKIEAEGSPRELKKQIAGDVVLLGLSADGAHNEKALELFSTQPYVREASYEQGHLRLYVHEGEATLPEILRLLDHAQIGLKTISLSQPTLDDVFLRQTGRSLQEA